MRRALAGLVVMLLPAAGIEAQGLRGQISQLFIFGSGQDPLFLAGSADPNNPASIQVHGNHFVPAAAEGNGTIISFITGAISTNVADFPFSAASSGATFRFEGGVPVRTSISSGPVFAERAQTLGRGRTLIGVSYNSFSYRTLRGNDLDRIILTFTHANVDNPACDSIQGQDCAPMGVPTLENDLMVFTLSLDLDVSVTSFVLTYGVSDRLDVGLAVPVVSTSLRGSSRAEIIPFGGPTAAHFFAGTPDDPELSASRFVEGSATGLGDLALRVKLGLRSTPRSGIALLADARFPTGGEKDLLGSGRFSGRFLAVVSGRFESFSPHANVGYLFREGELQNDAVLATLGFDHLMAPWATLALDLIAQLQVGDSKLLVPGTVFIERPFNRTVTPTSIPDRRDDVVNGSVGVRLTTARDLTVVLNTLWPLNRGGLRPNVLWTGGLEFSF
jgi:hypothetical protein